MVVWAVLRTLVLLQLVLMSGSAIVKIDAQTYPPNRSYEVIEDTPVYSLPNESSEQIASIPSGMRVNVFAEYGEWIEIWSKHEPSDKPKTRRQEPTTLSTECKYIYPPRFAGRIGLFR